MTSEKSTGMDRAENGDLGDRPNATPDRPGVSGSPAIRQRADRSRPGRSWLNVVAGAVLLMALVSGCGDDDESGPDGPGEDPPTATTVPEVGDSLDDDIRINELQVIGSHNSFHAAPDPAEHALLAEMNEDQALQRLYDHAPITDQLTTHRVRQFEFDVFADAQGGLYATPELRTRAALPPLTEVFPEMAEPGTKVLHEQDVDYHSVCPTLVSCLTEIRDWSDANPDHAPIAIAIQFKDGPLIFPVPEQAVPEPWDAAAMDVLDTEITSVFGRDRILAPDDVRGDRATLEEAVLTDGWPTLGDARGKVMFTMVNGDPYRSTYLEGHPNLEGRILFTNAEPGQPDAAVLNVDDPLEEPGRIAGLVAEGYLVRTRADTPDVHARTGDTSRLEAALASGAHWVGTDHPGPDGAADQYGTDYVAQLPGFLAVRCNPVTAPTSCSDDTLERVS